MVSILIPDSVIAFAHILCSHVKLFFPLLFSYFTYLVASGLGPDFLFFLLLAASQIHVFLYDYSLSSY